VSGRDNHAPLLLDVSRMIWRRWSGTRATGIDRICEAWIEHYAHRAQAVIIHRRGKTILPFGTSQALFALLDRPEVDLADVMRFRVALTKLALTRIGDLRDRLDGRGRVWLNPGHTGLDSPQLLAWVRRRNVRPVHLIHDLIPITHPQFCRDGELERHQRRMRGALQSAAGIVTNSANTFDALKSFADLEGLKMPPAIVAWPGTPALIPSSPVHQDRPTFVILGTIEGRKNHNLLLAVWRELLEASGDGPHPLLVIVGRRGWQADEVFSQLDRGAFAGMVREAGPLNDQELADLLSGARALLFPSFAEGYGIPLVEALAFGVPVIASDLPVFREIGQGVPDLLPADDISAWHRAVLDYSLEPSPRREAQRARLANFIAPGWKKHFGKVDTLLSAIGP
jgi:glycosyltransferase involved in cell wall biosynthesis